MKKERNNAIDIFRYICALMVVIIHTNPFYTGTFAPVGIFLKQFFARVAVPYFFVVSGYFLFLKLDSDEKSGYRAAWNQIKTYIIWSIPYILINFWILHDDGFSLVSFTKDVIVRFIVYGSSSHFWFFPALIYGTILVTFFYKRFGWNTVSIISIILYLIGCLGSTYLPIGEHIPILSKLFAFSDFYVFVRLFMTGIPFLVLGGFIARNCDKLKSIVNSRAKELLALLICIVLFVLEKVLLLMLGWSIINPNTLMLYPLITIIMILLLKHPLSTKTTLSQYSRTCANFIYYTHMAFILIAERALAVLFNITLHSALMFLLISSVLTVIGIVLHRIKFVRKWLN